MKKIALFFLFFPLFIFHAIHCDEGVRPAIVFDFGNVMATSDKSDYYAFVAKAFSIPVSEVSPLLKQVRKWRRKISDEYAWSLFAKERGVTLPSDWVTQCHAYQMGAIRLRPEMVALVQNLKAEGYSVALLSNVSKAKARLLRKLGYYDSFDPLLLSCEIGVSKPKAASYQLLLKQLKRPASEVVFIDDRLENITAANRLGIDAIHFTSYANILKELHQRKIMTGLTK